MKFLNFVIKCFLRIVMPKEARRMESDGAMAQVSVKGILDDADDYVLIDDQGADLTVFAFSGLDALFGGQTRFEFRGVFNKIDRKCNLVCFRDLRRACFCVAPDGTLTGLDFFTEKTKELMESLGATHNVTLGASMGGQMAFIVGTRCGVDRIVAFSPVFPTRFLSAPTAMLRNAFNIKLLVSEPKAYVELVVVTFIALWLENWQGKKCDWDRDLPLREYEAAGENRPNATLIYGERSGPDSLHAESLRRFPQVKLRPVPSGRHNSPVALKERGELGTALAEELSFDSTERDGDVMGAASQETESPIER
jgi:pimeloyl-ACP methyl ester carboxylesterase